MNNKDWRKELKELEIIIQDGFLKDCLVYHESTKTLIEEIIKQTRIETQTAINNAIKGKPTHDDLKILREMQQYEQ